MKKIVSALLSLLCLTICSEIAVSQTITNQFRRLRVEAMARDAIFDEDDVIVNDSDVFRDPGQYQNAIAVAANTITGFTNASSSQNNKASIDVTGNTFFAAGLTETTSVEDGSSSNFSDSLFRMDFTFNNPGTLHLEDVELEAYRANINDDPRDDEFERSDSAIVRVRVIRRDGTNASVFNRIIRLREDDERVELRDQFDIDLGAGDYRLIILARITGDDQFNTVQGQPRGSNAYYFVEGSLSEATAAPVFQAIEQEISGSFVGNDPFGEDPPSGADAISDDTFTAFNESLDLSEASTTTIANQSSDVDPGSGVYYAYGAAASGLYVQGSASSNAASCFETQFQLSGSGQVNIEGLIGVSDFLGTNQAQAEPGSASVILLVTDAVTGDELFDESVSMTGWIPGGLRETEISETVNLPAGSYKLIIKANSSDSADYEEVAGSLAVGFFEIEGSISQN